MDFLRSRNVDLVFDVGANEGDYAQQIRRWGYDGKIVSLEPTSDAHGKMVAAMKHDPNWTGLHCAAGAEAGEAQINVSQNTKFSSILSASEAGRAFDPNINPVAVETVPVIPVDSLLGHHPCDRPYLKIDTQGFEQMVLAGAQDLLKRCVGVQLELPIEHLYEGVWSFEEALAYMRERGFLPAQMTPVTAMTRDKASFTEFDCVFRRA